MKTFKTETCNVQYDVQELKFKDLNVEKSRVTTLKSKSELFRKMYDAGVEISEISKCCESHYSFVYSVISSSREVRKVVKVTTSDQIRELADKGLTPGAIAKQLQKNYSFVFSVVKKHKQNKEQETTEK